MKLIFDMMTAILSPNMTKGHHWSQTYKKSQEHKKYGYYLAQGFCNEEFNHKDKLMLKIKVFNRTNKKLDWDNMVSSLKYIQDGIFLYFSEAIDNRINDNQICKVEIDISVIADSNPRIEWELNKIN